MRILSTGWIAMWWLNRWHAEQIGIADKVGVAYAFIRQKIAYSSDAANHPLATSLATSADAHAWLGAWDFR